MKDETMRTARDKVVKIENLEKQVKHKSLEIDNLRRKIEKLEKITQESNFWDHPDKAQKTLKEISKIKIWTSAFNKAKTELDELVILDEFLSEGESSEIEVQKKFQNPFCFLAIAMCRVLVSNTVFFGLLKKALKKYLLFLNFFAQTVY